MAEESDFAAFLTGSYTYGTPTDESDIDLVVCMSPWELQILAQMSDNPPVLYEQEDGKQYIMDAREFNLRFGRLNLICLPPYKYAAWKKATIELSKMAFFNDSPPTRDEAIMTIDRHIEEMNHTQETSNAVH